MRWMSCKRYETEFLEQLGGIYHAQRVYEQPVRNVTALQARLAGVFTGNERREWQRTENTKGSGDDALGMFKREERDAEIYCVSLSRVSKCSASVPLAKNVA